MEVSDEFLVNNQDWDPSYLATLVSSDFYEFSDLWTNSLSDFDLVQEMEKVETYCPVVEDISMEDDDLCRAVEKIELE